MIWRLLQLDSLLLLVAPILIIFLIALAIDAGVTKRRERKAAEAAAWAAQAYGAGWDPQGALSVQKPRRGSKVVSLLRHFGIRYPGKRRLFGRCWCSW